MLLYKHQKLALFTCIIYDLYIVAGCTSFSNVTTYILASEYAGLAFDSVTGNVFYAALEETPGTQYVSGFNIYDVNSTFEYECKCNCKP